MKTNSFQINRQVVCCLFLRHSAGCLTPVDLRALPAEFPVPLL